MTRRRFIGRSSCALGAVLAASGVSSAAALARPIAVRDLSAQGAERSYALPSADGISIDQDNEVILARSEKHIFAFALACPHESAALRWRSQDQRFLCPKHGAKFLTDGAYLSGRATRNMDRFALRRDNDRVIVNLDKLFRSDQQKTEWDAAVITLDEARPRR